MSIRFALSGVANRRLSAARMGTLTARLVRARRRIAAWFIAMTVSFLCFLDHGFQITTLVRS